MSYGNTFVPKFRKNNFPLSNWNANKTANSFEVLDKKPNTYKINGLSRIKTKEVLLSFIKGTKKVCINASYVLFDSFLIYRYYQQNKKIFDAT